MSHLLEVRDLEVKFALRSGDITAIDGIDFTLDQGERLGIVGESGAGKSVTGFSIINLISKPGFISRGSIYFEGNKISDYSDSQMRTIRGNRISMIFQDPMMTLNPVFTIGFQMIETLRAHKKISKSDARAIALEKLKKVQIPSPEERLDQYPHELSGGMRQRIIIAISLLVNPAIIIADEPTTALDVTIQAEIMDLLQQLCETEKMGLILITHDLGVVSQVTEKIAVMYAGKIIEFGPTDQVVHSPVHPYTTGLIGSIPGSTAPGEKLLQIPGMMPTLSNIPEGCAFNPRCDLCEPICTRKTPPLEKKQNGTMAACHIKD
ncbi:MAG: ABC transporter ATP-binding protein [Desulfobacteraceae bacterium]|nr:ABC transporter ATP-binding protein [Desulfobacteraceae bacterium]